MKSQLEDDEDVEALQQNQGKVSFQIVYGLHFSLDQTSVTQRNATWPNWISSF